MCFEFFFVIFLKNLVYNKIKKMLFKLLENCTSCDVFAFSLHKCLIFFSLTENLGSYDSLLLHCGLGADSLPCLLSRIP